jgi:hypothetical protein
VINSGSQGFCPQVTGRYTLTGHIDLALVAQRIEHLTTDQKVGGSNPSERAPLERADEMNVVALLLGQAESRVPEPVPIRHGRMLVSPFS